jgi:hypothetical protein
MLVGIGFYIITGFSTLMMADDYCYFSLTKNSNFFSALIDSYTSAIVIAGNRFSATFFSILVPYVGINFIKFMPFLTVVSLIISISLLVQIILRFFALEPSLTVNLIISLLFAGILFYIVPSQFQNVYWFSGVIAYTTPLFFYTLTLVFYFSMLQKDRYPIWMMIFLILFSFITSGFSETSAVTFLVHILLIILFLISTKSVKVNNPKIYLPIIGLTVGIVLLVISPSAIMRNSGGSGIGFGINEPIKLLSTSFSFGFDFIIDQFRSYTLPLIILVIGMICVGGLIEIPKNTTAIKKIAFSIVFTILSTYIVISASMSPQIFAFGAYPNHRSQIIPLFFLLLGFSFIGIIIGILLYKKINVSKVFLVLPLILISLYMVRAGYSSYSFKNELSGRSLLWDERNSFIMSQVEKGIVDVSIMGVDRIESIMDFNPVCLREFYQIRNIEILN